MKTQKRNPSQRAFAKGYQVGFCGRSQDICPHSGNTPQSQEWVHGWQEGHADYLSGYSVAASQERFASL